MSPIEAGIVVVNVGQKFLREADYQEDWFSSMLKIHNKRRRPGDRLHRTDPRREE